MFIHGNYVFGQLKQNIPVDGRVVIGRTSDITMDGLTGTVLGQSGCDVFDTYIVLLDEPYRGQKAISITEACLCPL